MSTPPQNPRPSARIRTQRTSSRDPASVTRPGSVFHPPLSKAFTGGWSNTTSAMRSEISTWIGMLMAP
jgi:hypothetical protein